MVAVEGWASGQEPAELLGAVGPPLDPAEDDLWVDRALGWLTLRTGLKGISRSSSAACRIRFRIDRQAMVRLWLALPASSFCHC